MMSTSLPPYEEQSGPSFYYKTIQQEAKRCSSELRAISLEIHGKRSFLALKLSNNSPTDNSTCLSSVDHPELAYHETSVILAHP
jgi:hypothetical protein